MRIVLAMAALALLLAPTAPAKFNLFLAVGGGG
jgi:hypothetical protein